MGFSYSDFLTRILPKLHTQSVEQYLPQDYSPRPGFHRPFITIAREPGSGGHPIGRKVADQLGFEFIDDEIIEEVAKSTKRRKEVLAQVDEKGRTVIEDLVHGLINPDYVSDVTYVSELTKVIVSYAYRGNVVILGRGANFLTPFAQGLHVRITAPDSVRLQRAVDYEGHSYEKAKEIVKKYEKDRRDFVKQYFRKDISDADYYDLTLNTTYFSQENSVDLIVNAFRAKFPKFPFSLIPKK